MSLNLRRDVASDGLNAWPRRVGAIASLVDREAPHVLATQEGLPHQLADLDARLPGWRRVGGDRDGTGEGEHVAVFYDPRRLLLVAHGDVWLSDTPDVPASRSWGNRLPRHATWARFSDHEAGASFTLVNTHLDHESAASREKAAAFLARRYPDALLVGDFNDAPGSPTYEALTRTHTDVHALEAAGTFHGFGVVAGERIDWVLAPRSLAVVSSAVLCDEVSDHFPVVAELVPTAPREVVGRLA